MLSKCICGLYRKKSQISKKEIINKFIQYDNQYYFAEQINKILEVTKILLMCAASAVFLKPINDKL
jgi:hypothetical protein